MQRYIWWGGGGLVVIAAAVLLFSWRSNHHPPAPVASGTTATTTTPAAPPAIQNPVPASTGATQSLPSLEGSDQPMRDSLGEVIGRKAADALFRPEQIIRHIVVTIDNLSRKRTAVELRPTKSLPGTFAVNGDEQHSTLDPANYQRYAAIVQVARTVDTKQVASLYFHYYPLFQQSYQDLGYPNGYFNDRLVATIDNLLATPDVSGDIELVRPNVMYQFADPNLEDLSAGQKALLRMGPQNSAIVKKKLLELRAEIAGAAQTSAPAAAPSPSH
jgi:Protein of unknown function (DUF3014)